MTIVPQHFRIISLSIKRNPYCQLKHSHLTTHCEYKYIYKRIALMRINASYFIYACSKRGALKGHHFVIKRENETNIMLQCYLSFLSDQRKKKETLSAKLFKRKRERERAPECGRERMKEREVRVRTKDCDSRE